MSQQLELFATLEDNTMTQRREAQSTSSSQSGSQKKARIMPKKWVFVTNHQNLLMYLAMNVITTPQIVGKKHYHDSLNLKSGYIPIFADKAPKWSVNMSTTERDDLIPVMIEIDLQRFQGQVLAHRRVDVQEQSLHEQNLLDQNSSDLSNSNQTQADHNLHNQNTKNPNTTWCNISLDELYAEQTDLADEIDLSMLMLSAPLATALFKSIKFPNTQGIKKVKDKVLDTNNVDISPYKMGTAATLFKFSAKQIAAEETLDSVTSHIADISEKQSQSPSINYTFANALAAIYAALNIMANVNEQALHAILILIQQPLNDINLQPIDDVLADFCRWVLDPHTQVHNKAGQLFIDMVLQIIAANNSNQAKRNIVELLQSQIEPEHTPSESQNFIDDLSAMLGLANKSFDELMNSYSKSFHRMLLTFFHADGIERFLDMDKSRLTNSESALAMIMVAASTGWLKLPKALKAYAGMNKNMSLLLSSFCRTQYGMQQQDISLANEDGIDRDNALSLLTDSQYAQSSFDLPVRYYLKKSWTKKPQQAAKLLIKDQDWQCMDYEISLPNGKYDIQTTAKFLKFTSKQPIKVDEIVYQDEFLALMTTLKYIDSKVEQAMRKELGV